LRVSSLRSAAEPATTPMVEQTPVRPVGIGSCELKALVCPQGYSREYSRSDHIKEHLEGRLNPPCRFDLWIDLVNPLV